MQPAGPPQPTAGALRLVGAQRELRTAGGVVVGPGPAEQVVDLAGCVLLPGFVELHVHGGGGHDVTTSPAELDAAVAFHHRRGTAATLVSLMTAPVEALCEQLSWVADACERGVGAGRVLGAHLEGPFLSWVRCGAQPAEHLRAPDRAVFADLLAAARGHLRVLTVAPELPGADAVIDDALAAGVVVAIGHTDASFETAVAAVERGARLVTHLFNGMPPMHHREPGPALAALDRGLACEVILDGLHVHPAAARLVRDRARPVLVTDAMAAAGAGDGSYALGGREVEVRDGAARLAGDGSLAGSTLTLDAAAGRALRDGWSPDALARATSGTAAGLLGVADRYGSLEPGRLADAVALRADGTLRGTLSAGRWVDAAEPPGGG